MNFNVFNEDCSKVKNAPNVHICTFHTVSQMPFGKVKETVLHVAAVYNTTSLNMLCDLLKSNRFSIYLSYE